MLYQHKKTKARIKVVTEWDDGDWLMVEDQDGRIFTVYKTEPNSAGWFTEESIRAKGAKLSINGEVKHYKCITEPENCSTTDYTTSKLGDAIGLEIKDLDVTKISDKETINTVKEKTPIEKPMSLTLHNELSIAV